MLHNGGNLFADIWKYDKNNRNIVNILADNKKHIK